MRPSSSRAWPARRRDILREQMVLFKQDRRNPGRRRRSTALKALMKTIPDATFADLAAYYSSLR